MLLTLAHIGAKSSGSKSTAKAHYEPLTRLYLDRIASYHPLQSEAFASEAAFLAWLTRQHARTPALPILLHRQGRQLASDELAAWLGQRRDQGAQHLVFAIGPPDGWSAQALAQVQPQSHLLLSFGPITMPHELARLVLAEQLYRACTILTGHPYHSGH